MFFSRLGPAIAAHSACREGSLSVSYIIQELLQEQSFIIKCSLYHPCLGIPIQTAPRPFMNLSVLPVEAGCDLDAEGGASGTDPAYTSGR